jgi:hypothetical protein
MLQNLALAYSYSYSSTSNSSHSGNAAIIIAAVLIGLIVYIVEVIAFWKLFQKAGRPGWPAIIPIYNTWVLFEIAGKPGWWALLGLSGIIPVLGLVGGIAFFVLYIIAMLELARRFGKSTTFAVVGLIIFSIVGLLILAFGPAKYEPLTEAPPKADPPLPPVNSVNPAISPAHNPVTQAPAENVNGEKPLDSQPPTPPASPIS